MVAVQFLHVPEEDLTEVENLTIDAQRRAGFSLRNKTRNCGFVGPSVLDAQISPEEQQHWACGDLEADPEDLASAAQRDPGDEPRLFSKEDGARTLDIYVEPLAVADAVLEDLAVLGRARSPVTTR